MYMCIYIHIDRREPVLTNRIPRVCIAGSLVRDVIAAYLVKSFRV